MKKDKLILALAIVVVCALVLVAEKYLGFLSITGAAVTDTGSSGISKTISALFVFLAIGLLVAAIALFNYFKK